MADIDTTDSLTPGGTSKAKATTGSAKAKPKANSGAGSAIRDGASKLTQQATEKARSYAEEGKNITADGLDEFSKLMGDAASSVDERLGPQYGKYARSAADAISNFSTSIKSKEIDTLIADARDLVKKSPAVAIGTAAAVGFAIARLIKAGLDAAEEDSDKRA
ncbi:hypothetical protein BH09PSE4_BH09PSE4_07700 [soil metagenome]